MEEGLEGLLGLNATFGGLHLSVRDKLLGVDLSGKSVPSGHDVVEVDNLQEGLNAGALLDLLLRHTTSDLQGVSLDTSDQTVSVGTSLGSLLKSLDDHGLLASHTALQEEHDAACLEELHGHRVKL